MINIRIKDVETSCCIILLLGFAPRRVAPKANG